MTCEPAFNYGRDVHVMDIVNCGATFATDALRCVLSTQVPLARIPGRAGAVTAYFTVREGSIEVFLFEGGQGEAAVVAPLSPMHAEVLLLQTTAFWQAWIA